MDIFVTLFSFIMALALATEPIYFLDVLPPRTVAAINLVGWSFVILLLLVRFDFRRRIYLIAKNLEIDTRFKGFEELLSTLIREVRRKHDAFAINLLEKKISSEKELSRALESIVALAFRLLNAESAELALFDRESGMYHSSFVLGKPFRTSAQAMLNNAVDGGKEEVSPDVLVHPITFSGSVLGTLRVALKRGTLPGQSDREVLRLLALQGGLAIINAQYTDQLLKMRRSSEETVKAKTGFLANLSHEIRGPLGIMLNAVELVLDGLCGQITADQSETLAMVKTNGEHLLDLINDVLDYAKVESGRVVPQKSQILLNDLLKDIIGVVRTQAEAKNHKLSLRNSEEALAISCDKRHLRQMLINLLTNAIKYTPDGGTIELWAERVPVHKIRINVKDSGVGIDEANRHKVFAAFERVENAYSAQQVGTGLGMPLTKKLAEVNGGLVDFRSSVGKGSHFWLLFPTIEYSSASTVLEESEAEHRVEGKGEAILIVEKEEGERKMLTRYLASLGFNPVGAVTRLEALEVLRSRQVDLVLIDNSTADNKGEDLIAGIRENSTKANLPIVLVSSRAFAFDIEKYLKAGIDRCLIKPLELRTLGVTIRKLIDGTFSGAVLDSSELDLTQQKKNESKPAKGPTRVMELDDILH
ncbi:MAG: hybrid sensor histidine kinase/response regulator [Oligoflexia bacterium]|nr:hybrid sensor histidine kinase/response regulator [Oligoflexia bacterium]